MCRTGRCGKGRRERRQSNASKATLRIHHFIVVSAGQRRCKSKARSTLRKSLPRGGTNIPVERAAATIPQAYSRQQPLQSPRSLGACSFQQTFPCFCLQAFTPEYQRHPLAGTCSASVGSQDVCSHAGTGLAPSCLPRSHPLGIHPCGRDDVWFCLKSLQARKVLRADEAKPEFAASAARHGTDFSVRASSTETSCCTGLSLHCSQKCSSSERKGLQPPRGGTDSARGFICEASELLPTPSSSSSGKPLWNRVLDKDFSFLQLGTSKPSNFSY